MAKMPHDRYESADELRADLLRFQQGQTVMAFPPTLVETPMLAEEVAAKKLPAVQERLPESPLVVAMFDDRAAAADWLGVSPAMLAEE